MRTPRATTTRPAAIGPRDQHHGFQEHGQRRGGALFPTPRAAPTRPAATSRSGPTPRAPTHGQRGNALYSNTTGASTRPAVVRPLYYNTTATTTRRAAPRVVGQHDGFANTRAGSGAPFPTPRASPTPPSGQVAHLIGNTTGAANTALGAMPDSTRRRQLYLFLGAEVGGTAADTTPIRIGLPYSAGTGRTTTSSPGSMHADNGACRGH